MEATKCAPCGLTRVWSPSRHCDKREYQYLATPGSRCFTMIDWRYRHGRKPLANYRLELGLYKLGDPEGPRWIPTPLVPHFMAYRSNPEASIGTLAPPPATEE